MCELFSIFRRRSLTQSPHQYQTGSNFDHRIEPKTDQRDTTGKNAGDNSDDRFESCPADTQKFNSQAGSTMNRSSLSEIRHCLVYAVIFQASLRLRQLAKRDRKYAETLGTLDRAVGSHRSGPSYYLKLSRASPQRQTPRLLHNFRSNLSRGEKIR